MGDRNVYREPQIGLPADAGSACVLGGDFSLVTGDLALNKTVGLFIVPKGFCVTGVIVNVTDMDTGGSPALVFAIGDSGDDDRFVTGATTAQAGGTNTTLAATGLLYTFTADTEIMWKTTTAAATAAAGTAKVYLVGFVK